MSIRFALAKSTGQFTRWALRKLKRNATSLPGKISLKIDPLFFESVTKDMKVVMVTGTNGKTLTTSLITHTLKEKYKVLTNESGSNMEQGIASTFLQSKNQEIAVLEVDEANLKKLTPYITPDVIVFTNVFQDQTDRFSDIYATYDYMKEGVKLTPSSKLLVNGDIPLFNHDDLVNTKEFFGFNLNQADDASTLSKAGVTKEDGHCPNCNTVLHYNHITYANLGDYFCSNCGFKRPTLKYQVTAITNQSKNKSSFHINNSPFHIEVGGLYNIYNALAAYSVAKHFGLDDQQIQNGFSNTPMKFGRQESFYLDDKEVIINLVKNPVGFNQIVDLIELDKNQKDLICLFNDNYADGIDISWINDADFEKLSTLNIHETVVAGLRVDDLHKRLNSAGFSHITPFDSLDKVISNIKNLKHDTIYVLATYTALLSFRELLSKAGYVNNDMN